MTAGIIFRSKGARKDEPARDAAAEQAYEIKRLTDKVMFMFLSLREN